MVGHVRRVLNADGTPHESNKRATIDEDDDDFWFGFEQEYTLIDVETNLAEFPKDQMHPDPKDLTIARRSGPGNTKSG